MRKLSTPKLSQDAFYFTHGIPPSTGKAWEQGRNVPKLDSFCKLLDSLKPAVGWEVLLELIPQRESLLLKKLNVSASEQVARIALHEGLQIILDLPKDHPVRGKIAEMLEHFGGAYGRPKEDRE